MNPIYDFRGQVALVTGASSGMGLATARAFAEAGAAVVLADINEGALRTATTYTRHRTRPWPYAVDVKETGADEFYILETYGDLRSKLWAAEALAERAAEAIERINEHAATVTPQERGEAAVLIAAAKQRAIDTGLEIGTRIFEVTGARATASSVGLDIFWRNIRTHSLHDPVAHKRAEVGRYTLLGELPEPTWYT